MIEKIKKNGFIVKFKQENFLILGLFGNKLLPNKSNILKALTATEEDKKFKKIYNKIVKLLGIENKKDEIITTNKI